MKSKLHLVSLDERAMPSVTVVDYLAPVATETAPEALQRPSAADVIAAIRVVLGRDDETRSILAGFDESNGDIIIGAIQGGGPGVFYPSGQEVSRVQQS